METNNNKVWTGIIVAAVIIVILIGLARKTALGVDRDAYQAVFLSNGQTYFGKLSDVDKNFISFTDVYYLQRDEQIQEGEEVSKTQLSLIKLGVEIHGPQDQIFFNREHVLFWENLKDDGSVVQAIYKKKLQEAASSGS